MAINFVLKLKKLLIQLMDVSAENIQKFTNHHTVWITVYDSILGHETKSVGTQTVFWIH